MTADMDATGRLIAALSNPQHLFTPVQAAHLMGLAARWAREDRDGEPDPLTYRAGWLAGYRARCAEENAQYLHDVANPVFRASSPMADKRLARARRLARLDAHARRRRHGDHRGGPVPAWDIPSPKDS